MAEHCENCGVRMYRGICSNCHEELYILTFQDEDIVFSQEFIDKAGEQQREIAQRDSEDKR